MTSYSTLGSLLTCSGSYMYQNWEVVLNSEESTGTKFVSTDLL